MRSSEHHLPKENRADLRFGLIGCGGIGELRARTLKQAKNMRLAVVSDADQSKSSQLSKRFGAIAEPDWRKLVMRDDIDAVIVATPHFLHCEMAVAALEAGKHVLVEKPLACTPAEGQCMVDAAEQFGRFLGIGFNYRFFPSVRKARALLDSGIIGPLDHVRGYAGYSATSIGQSWVRDASASGGGALHDIGIHLLDLTCYFLGGVAEFKGWASNRIWNNPGCEDNGLVLLRSPTGQLASIAASWTEWRGYFFKLELHGHHGCIELSCFPMTTTVTWSDQPGGRTRRRRHWFPIDQIREKFLSYRAIVLDTFALELQAFFNSVRGVESPIATGDEGLLALKIAHAVNHETATTSQSVSG